MHCRGWARAPWAHLMPSSQVKPTVWWSWWKGASRSSHLSLAVPSRAICLLSLLADPKLEHPHNSLPASLWEDTGLDTEHCLSLSACCFQEPCTDLLLCLKLWSPFLHLFPDDEGLNITHKDILWRSYQCPHSQNAKDLSLTGGHLTPASASTPGISLVDHSHLNGETPSSPLYS